MFLAYGPFLPLEVGPIQSRIIGHRTVPQNFGFKLKPTFSRYSNRLLSPPCKKKVRFDPEAVQMKHEMKEKLKKTGVGILRELKE